MNARKVLEKARSGSRNIAFRDLVSLVEAIGFVKRRTRGSHHLFKHPQVPELVNLQSDKGKAIPYQIDQVLRIIDTYRLDIG